MAGKGALLAVLMCAAVMVWMAEGDIIDCGSVTSDMEPCINYLTTGMGVPSSNCCAGLRSVAAAATTTPQRMVACTCLELAAGMIPGIKANAVSSLPGACNVKLPFPFSLTTDCSKIQ
eukprot:Gb_21553 [translate_table: standard]